jgi:predicted ATP-grasp superfamily ATP-dependent carboligase
VTSSPEKPHDSDPTGLRVVAKAVNELRAERDQLQAEAERLRSLVERLADALEHVHRTFGGSHEHLLIAEARRALAGE